LLRVCGVDDFDEFVRRLVFAILSANPDAHLKNWSLLYVDGRKPRLAPAYDLVSASPYSRFPKVMACRLAGEERMSEIREWHFGRLAQHADLDHTRVIALVRDTLERVHAAFHELTSELPQDYASAVASHLGKTRFSE